MTYRFVESNEGFVEGNEEFVEGGEWFTDIPKRFVQGGGLFI